MGRQGSDSALETARLIRSAGNRPAEEEGERWTADTRLREFGPEGIEAVARGESAAGRGRPASVRRSPSQLAQQRAERGVGGVASHGVHGRLGGCRWGGGFGALAGGVPIQGATALVGRRRGGFLAAAVTTAALDRLIALMLEPFAEAEDLNRATGTPRMAGRPR